MSFFWGLNGFGVRCGFKESPHGLTEVYSRTQITWNTSAYCDDFDSRNLKTTDPKLILRTWNESVTRNGSVDIGHKVDSVVRANLGLCCAIPFIARPLLQLPTSNAPMYNFPSLKSDELKRKLVVFLEMQLSDILDICQTVSPERANMNTTGARISRSVIGSCIQLENLLATILTANWNDAPSRLNTNHLVMLMHPMRLGDFVVSFPRFSLPALQPFKDWEVDFPTASLPWLDRYNKAKHNIHDVTCQPTIDDAFSALSAVFIACTSAFGWVRSGMSGSTILRENIDLERRPTWDVSDCVLTTVNASGRTFLCEQKCFG